jgi:retinol dehydrogenase 12
MSKYDESRKARKEILASAKRSSPGTVEIWQLDMAEYGSVLAFGERIQKISRLNVFIANAGIETTHFERFEGNESTLTVNVISTILVSLLAIPKLRETSNAQAKPSHLVITRSAVHIWAKPEHLVAPKPGHIFESLNNESTADMSDRYNLSKLLLLLAVRKLAEALTGSMEKGHVILTIVNPGWCKTDLFRTIDLGKGQGFGLRLIGSTAEEGSRTLVYGAAAGADAHGKFMSESRIKPESTVRIFGEQKTSYFIPNPEQIYVVPRH